MCEKQAPDSWKQRMVPGMLLLSVLLSFLAAGVLYFDFARFPKVDVSGYRTDEGSVLFHVDGTGTDSGCLYVWGWLVHENPMQYADCTVVLRDGADGCVRGMKTVMDRRDDLPGTLQIEGAELGGFRARTPLGNLRENGAYQLLLLCRGGSGDRLVDTGIWINEKGGRIHEET